MSDHKMNVQTAARVLGKSRSTILRLIRSDALKAERTPGGFIIDEDELLRFIKAGFPSGYCAKDASAK